MTPRLLKNIISELNEKLKDGVISRIHQSDNRNVILKVFAKGRTVSLLISADPKLPRLHVTGYEFRNPQRPLRFCAYLRSSILNARIEAFEQVDDERIARIRLKKKSDGDYGSFTLVAELTGKSSNVILIDGKGVILDSLKYFSTDSVRAVLPGLELTPLPPFPPHGGGMEIERKEGESWNEAADRYFTALFKEDLFVLERGVLKRAVNEAEKKLKRKLDNLRNDVEKAGKGLDGERLGEILASNYGKIKRGMSEVIADDYTRVPPEKVRIELDPKLGPAENLEKYFKRAKKAKTAINLLKDRIPDVEKELEYIGSLMYEWETAKTEDDLGALKDELMEGGYLKKVREEITEKVEERAEPIRRYTSTEGFEILCGKSGPGNDLIIKKYARDEDIWFHASKMPGSHCLIKVAGRGKELTKKTIEEAASICAFYSKAQAASKVEVIYAEARHVKKPRGAKPGMVTVKEYKSIVVRPKPEI